MAVYRPSEARQQRSQTAPQEPSLVPIMNLFVTIIPFLMLMIVLSQVALVALNFESSGTTGGAGAGGGGSEQLIEIRLYASMHETGLFPGFEIRDLDNSTAKFPNYGETYDFASLQAKLIQLKDKYPEKSEIAVIVYPDVIYDTLIRTIDLCKQNGFVTVKYMNPKSSYYY